MEDPLSEEKQVRATGHCLCGAVRYEVRGPLRAGTACHCEQCRRSTGSLWHATAAYKDTLRIADDEGCLRWYVSSDHGRRGFCSRCGSTLFFDPVETERMAIALGTVDQPTGLRLENHIFVREKADYYDIADGATQYETEPDTLPMPARD